MIRKDKYIKEISLSLNLLRLQIETLSRVNLYDYNIIAEDFYKDLLVFYGYKLENLNVTQKNSDSIDLVDVENQIAIQVTSRNDTKKIHETIKGFYNNPEYDVFERLIILLIGKEKQKYSKTDFSQKGLFSFNKEEDIIDVADIISKFKGYKAEELEPIVRFMESEIDLKINVKPTKPNEVITIMKLIEYLSDDNNYKKGIKTNESDPDNKEIRFERQGFKSNFDFLMTKYSRLYGSYAGTLNEAKNSIGLEG